MWLRKAAVLLAATVLSLGAAEIVLREFATWAPRVDMRMYAEREGMVLLKPGFQGRHRTPLWDVEIAIGDNGWRDPAEQSPEFLLIGDSFVFGWGVEREETFHHIWQDRGKTSVVALGLPGAGPCEYARLLERFGPEVNPKFVVVAFYAGNDFADAEPGCPERFAVRGGLLTPAGAPGGGLYGLLRQSQLLQTMRATSFAVAGGTRRRWDDGLRRFGEIHLRDPPERSRQAAREALNQLDRIANWCDEHRVQLAVAVIPRRAQIVRDEQQEWQEALGVSEDELDWRRPQEVLHRWAGERGAGLVDVHSRFLDQVSEGAELYHHPDAHLNAAGHALLADLLAGSGR